MEGRPWLSSWTNSGSRGRRAVSVFLKMSQRFIDRRLCQPVRRRACLIHNEIKFLQADFLILQRFELVQRAFERERVRQERPYHGIGDVHRRNLERAGDFEINHKVINLRNGFQKENPLLGGDAF